MLTSLLLRSVLVVMLAGSSIQQMVPQGTRAPMTSQYPGVGSPGFGSYNQGFPGYQGLGTGQGFPGQGTPGYRGVQGYPSDGRYGFEIVDTPDRYGYVSNYPGGRTSFFLLGPNRGPGQQSGWRGSSVGTAGGYQPGTYRPGTNGLGTNSLGTFRPGTNSLEPFRPGTNSLGGWRQPGAL